MLRPSLTLVLDLDEKLASKETVLEIKRSYAHIGTPVIRTHTAESGGASARNYARLLVKMGTHRYLRATGKDADELWTSVVEPWIGNILHKVGNNMKVFNDRQRSIGLPEVTFDRMNVELQGGELVVGLHPDPRSWIDPQLSAMIGTARDLLSNGILAGATRIDAPSDEAYEAQCKTAWSAWVAEHPEAVETAKNENTRNAKGVADESDIDRDPKADLAQTREQLLRMDAEAKSYENTAVPPTNSNTLPRPQREKPEPEPERFCFKVDYGIWAVECADGTRRMFDSASRSFVE